MRKSVWADDYSPTWTPVNHPYIYTLIYAHPGPSIRGWISSSSRRPNIFMDAYSLATVGRLHCSHAAAKVAEATNLAERQSIRNTIKSSQSEKFYAAAATATTAAAAYFPTKKLRKMQEKCREKKKFRKQKSLLAPDESYLSPAVRRGAPAGVLGVTKGAATKAQPQITLFATYEAASPLFSLFFVCLRRGLKTFNNASKLPSDFFHIINFGFKKQLMWSGHQWRSCCCCCICNLYRNLDPFFIF